MHKKDFHVNLEIEKMKPKNLFGEMEILRKFVIKGQ